MYLTSPPAWSFAKKYASKIESNAPGPGAYSPKGANLEKSPNYKIGTSSRDARRSSNSPGPGAYNPSKSEHSPAPKMGFSQREPLSDSLANPGPGTYQVPPKFQEGPKYSISGKHSTRLIGEVPGPGHYSQDLNAFTMKERPPSARIGTSQREDFTQNGRNAPGPGAYEVLRPQSAGPKWGFGNDARDKLFKSEAPGPGTYEMGNTLDRKAWSISGKHPEIGDKTSIPGPGAYDPKLFKADLPAYSVGRSSRSDFTKGFEKSPGPGTYENKGLRPSSSAPKLGTSKRPPLSQTEDIPGPGAYEFRSTNDGPQYSIPGRDAKQQRPKTPGPGHYNPDGSVTERAPQWRMGSARRDDGPPDGVRGQFPGPGAYTTERPQSAGPQWGFGSERRDKNNGNNVVGPGTYEIKSSLDYKSWSMSGKHPDLEQKKLGEYPGPGAYNPSADFGAPNYSIGRSQRPQSGKTGSPGPGAYSPKMRPSSSGPLIGTGKRPPLSDAFEIPGPGAYNFQSSVDGPQFSMTGRSYKSQKEKSPGPGAYSHKDLHKTPAYSVPRAPRTDRYGEEVPGPGNYELSARQTGTKWGFGTEARDRANLNAGPGPGAYALQPSLDKKSYSMSGRRPESARSSVPGPGAYNADNRVKSPAYSVGSSKRTDLVNDRKGSPGPGAYNLAKDFNKTAPSFGSSKRQPLSSVTDTPGPGGYNFKIGKVGPAFSMSARTHKGKGNDVPGPGQYNPNDSAGNPSWSVGREKRNEIHGLSKSQSLVGPGFYDIRGNLGGPKWGFGSSNRNGKVKVDAPGPGHYNLRSSIANIPTYAQVSN